LVNEQSLQNIRNRNRNQRAQLISIFIFIIHCWSVTSEAEHDVRGGRLLRLYHILTRHGLLSAGICQGVCRDVRVLYPVNRYCDFMATVIRKVKCPDIYIPPLSEQQRFTTRSGVLTSISSRQRSAISSSSLLERTDFGLDRADRPTVPQPAALWPSPCNVLWHDSLFLVASTTRYLLLLICLPRRMEG